MNINLHKDYYKFDEYVNKCGQNLQVTINENHIRQQKETDVQ